MATSTRRSAPTSRPARPAAAPADAKPAPAAAPKAPKARTAPAPSPAAKGAAPGPAPKAPRPPKAPKTRSKPVRDSFTMPPADFALIATLKARALAGGRETKKSELLRAGLQALAALEPATLLEALGRLAPVKIGRPSKGR